MKLIYDFILVTGVIISIIILFLLLKEKNKKLQKKILIIFFSLILVLNLHAYSALHRLEFLYKSTFIVNISIIWFLGPLIFIYLKSVFQEEQGLVGRNLKHFLGFFLFTLFIGLPISIFQLTNQPSFEYLQYLEANQTPVVILSNIIFIIYMYLSLGIFNKSKNIIQHSHSGLSKFDLSWIKNLLYGCLFFISVDIVTRLIDETSITTAINTDYFTMFSIIILISYLGFHGISQSKILLPSFLLDKDFMLINNSTQQHSLSNYSHDAITNLIENLTALMREDKPYLDPELTLGKLAKSIGITDKKLSTLFNSYLETTFYDYVNSFRIKDVKKSLQDVDNMKYTLLSLAMDSGFNSKASFNRVFKKETGLSPSQYRKEYMNHSIKTSF